jgi:hypothetical protein
MPHTQQFASTGHLRERLSGNLREMRSRYLSQMEDLQRQQRLLQRQSSLLRRIDAVLSVFRSPICSDDKDNQD